MVAQLPAGDYQVMIAVNERPYLIEIVQDEHAAEQVLWERMRIRNMRFMPVQPGSKPPKLIYVLPTWSQRLTTFFRKFFALRWSK